MKAKVNEIRVLLVGGDEVVEMAITSQIKDILRHDLKTSQSLARARGRLASEEYDLIVFEADLQESGGLDLIRAVEDSNPGTRMIGISDDPVTRDTIESVGCTATGRSTFPEVLRVEIREICKTTA